MYKIATFELEAKMASGVEVETIFRCIQETKESRDGKNHTKPKRGQQCKTYLVLLVGL